MDKKWTEIVKKSLESNNTGHEVSLVARDGVLSGELPLNVYGKIEESGGAGGRVIDDGDLEAIINMAIWKAMKSPRGIGTEYSTHSVPNAYKWITTSDWAYVAVGLDCEFGMTVFIHRTTMTATIRKRGADVGQRAFENAFGSLHALRAIMRGES